MTALGGFLVGLGAVLALLPRLLWPERPESGIPFETLRTRDERIRFAVETTGLASAAAGSIVLAIVDLTRWWLEVTIIALAALTAWGLAAHKLRELWLMRCRTARDDANASPPLASAEQQREFANQRARWAWCLWHAFAPTDHWPPLAAGAQHSNSQASEGSVSFSTPVRSFEGDRLKPSHIADLHAQDERVADLAIPDHIRADVAAMRDQGFRVHLAEDLVVVTAPDGRTAQVSRSSVDANSSTTVAARQLFLHRCEAIGVKLRTGARGQGSSE